MSNGLPEAGDILTTEEAAALLRVDTRTLYASVHAGAVPVIRLGATGRTWRFSRLALQQQLAQHTAVSPSLRTRGA